MGRRTVRVSANRITIGQAALPPQLEAVTVEEPLSIKVAGTPLTLLMRTPGADFDLTLGWLQTEGIITSAAQVHEMRHCQDLGADGLPTYNSVDVRLKPGVQLPELSLLRDFPSTSGCGICGTANIAAVKRRAPADLAHDQSRFSPQILATLPEKLRASQSDFQRTGGLHAAGLFRADGQLLAVREDIGRHNAVDKVLGWALRTDLLPPVGSVLVVTSRASFELAQKAAMAGVPCLATVSAPSSLAIELAREMSLTLIAFLRPPRLTVYADIGRIIEDG
jgi:FdhD protein